MASSCSDGNDLLFDGGDLRTHLTASGARLTSRLMTPQVWSSAQVTHLLHVLICCVWFSGFPPHSSPHRIVLVQGRLCEDVSDEIVDGWADLLILVVNEVAGSWSVARSTC
jgi:hypothetical protein